MNIQPCLRPVLLFLLLIISRDAVAQQSPEEKQVDIGKSLVELPLEQVVGEASLSGNARLKVPDAAVPRDAGKMLIEMPVEELIGESSFALNMPGDPGAADLQPDDPPKAGDREQFLELLADASATAQASSALPDSRQHLTVEPEQDNPTCSPGLVNWHSNWDAARKASEQSGKPVLLFQLLGQLDQTFT